MDFTHLQEHYHELLDYLQEDGYTKEYIRRVRESIKWILKNGEGGSWQSYVDAYHDRVSRSGSELYKKNQREAFGAIQQFDLFGEFPNRRAKNCFIKRGAYHQLIPEFKEMIDHYRLSAEKDGLEESTIKGYVSLKSCFLHYMQTRGIQSLGAIDEDDVPAFFSDDEGSVAKCSSYKKAVKSVLKITAGWKEECGVILTYLPQIRPRRKNVQFLTPDEVESIRKAISDEESSLSLRDKAIGRLLFFTGMRASDIAGMRLGSIDWELEEINISQRKTRQPFTLPLTITVGNAIYDYLVSERPESNSDQLFLNLPYPHYPLDSGAFWSLTAKIYREAGVRQEDGDRRGSHLFRHNVATSFLGSGIPRLVISQTLGQSDPASLNPYLHADLTNLRKCALSIEAFPVSEEVFLP